MQVSEIMTREVLTVAPDTPVRQAAELMAERGYAALPVLDPDALFVGMVSEADLLRHRVALMLRPDGRTYAWLLTLPVRATMSSRVRTVSPTADVADVARLLVDGHLRSVPVVDAGRLVGIVSRRDLLGVLTRTDDRIQQDLLRLVEDHTGEPGRWEVTVTEGMARIARTAGTPQGGAERHALEELAATVPGVVATSVVDPAPCATADPG